MNKVEMMYKADTGQRASVSFETDLLKDDDRQKHWAIKIDVLPDRYRDEFDVILPSLDYIKWLEEKVETMQLFPGNNI